MGKESAALPKRPRTAHRTAPRTSPPATHPLSLKDSVKAVIFVPYQTALSIYLQGTTQLLTLPTFMLDRKQSSCQQKITARSQMFYVHCNSLMKQNCAADHVPNAS